LALRGVHCVIVEMDHVNTGASGANHGLLHSGARYVASDPGSAMECREESELLKRLAPHCVEETGGLFVAVDGDDEGYVSEFPRLCRECGIQVRSLDLREAHEMEPALSDHSIAAYAVEDATINPFKLSLDNIFEAQRYGCKFLPHMKVIGFERDRRRIQVARLLNTQNGEETTVEAEQFVNAGGAWSDEIAALAGVKIELLYSKGSLAITDRRITHRVVNRLRPPGDGDILVPGGTVSILGTTSLRIESLEDIRPTVREVDRIVDEGSAMLPILDGIRYFRAFAGVRALLKTREGGGDRSVSRGIRLLDHVKDGFENFATIPAGKLTTFRYMAEKTADLVCRRLGVAEPCPTRSRPLPSTQKSDWSRPGYSPRQWLKEQDPGDAMICECEMVSARAIDGIMQAIELSNARPGLDTISVYSRTGKGPCQGTVCGRRLAGRLYDQGKVDGDQGLIQLRKFLRERWKGERPVLWDGQMMQAELKEAVYCGLLDLECRPGPFKG